MSNNDEITRLRAENERLREWNREIALNARELVAENERLRAALKTISDMTDYGTETATWRMTNVIHNTNVIARAALDGQPAPGKEEA